MTASAGISVNMAPVDKGGLAGGQPPASRVMLQRFCYGVGGLFAAGALVMAVAVAPGVSLIFAIPVSLCGIAGLALGLDKPSLRQRVTLWCVTVTLLSCSGIAMMERHPAPAVEMLRDFGFMAAAAAAVLAFICLFLPPYAGDRLLRLLSVVFCSFLLALTYMGVHFTCTPGGH